MKISPLLAAVALLALAALDAPTEAETMRRGDCRYTYVERVYVEREIPEYVTGEVTEYITSDVPEYVTREVPEYTTLEIPEYVTPEEPSYNIRIFATATKSTYIPVNHR